jgi:hypothetical protein
MPTVAAANDRAVDTACTNSGCGFGAAWMAMEPHVVGDTLNRSAEPAGAALDTIDHRAEKSMAT